MTWAGEIWESRDRRKEIFLTQISLFSLSTSCRKLLLCFLLSPSLPPSLRLLCGNYGNYGINNRRRRKETAQRSTDSTDTDARTAGVTCCPLLAAQLGVVNKLALVFTAAAQDSIPGPSLHAMCRSTGRLGSSPRWVNKSRTQSSARSAWPRCVRPFHSWPTTAPGSLIHASEKAVCCRPYWSRSITYKKKFS